MNIIMSASFLNVMLQLSNFIFICFKQKEHTIVYVPLICDLYFYQINKYNNNFN